MGGPGGYRSPCVPLPPAVEVRGPSNAGLHGKLMGFLGMFFGTGTAVGVPWAVLNHGAAVGVVAAVAAILCLVGIVGGLGMAFVSIEYTIVVPARKHSSNGERPET